MKIDLTGKTAVITGSTAGIGYAIARGLAEAGARVVLNGRAQEAVDRAAAQLRDEVAGVPRDFFDTPDELWERSFAVNVLSGVRLSRSYLPGMIRRGWGRIIFISSESALNIPADMIHYGLTKTADLALSRGLAKRAAGTGVTVNAILPGPTLSEGLRVMLSGVQAKTGKPIEEVAADFVKANRPSSIIQRAATAEEVANLVVYVASPLSSGTTGAALRVDGGVVDTIA
jgi:NAD(P)-dependent dehydrogenase (short-subunit alcohol dehydrogenase family)